MVPASGDLPLPPKNIHVTTCIGVHVATVTSLNVSDKRQFFALAGYKRTISLFIVQGVATLKTEPAQNHQLLRTVR